MDHLSETVDQETCPICARGCLIRENGTGACGNYTRCDGKLVELSPASYLVLCPISIETMPLLHFAPQGKFLQITTTGCNFSCPGCISTILVRDFGPKSPALKKMGAQELIAEAQQQQCLGIAFVMNDPLASLFTFLEVAQLAKEAGLLVVCSTNGYCTPTSANMLAPYLDGVNIGIKGHRTADYVACGAHSIEPVLDTLALFHRAGIHIEISITYRRGSEEGLQTLVADLLHRGFRLPIQLMRYIPLEDAAPELEPSVTEAERFCLRLRQDHPQVYLFNTPGTDLLHTQCEQCRALLIERDFYGPMGAKVRAIRLHDDATCPHCGQAQEIREMAVRQDFSEHHFLGGYPFTRALEMVQAMLLAMGVTERTVITRTWEKMLKHGALETLHEDIQSIDSYLDCIDRFADYAGCPGKAAPLIAYLSERVATIRAQARQAAHRPTVYYAMAKPLFALKGGRFENSLVQAAGGIPLNSRISGSGRPGCTITVEQLNALDPEVMVISSFLSNSTDAFFRECLDKGIEARAVRARRIFAHPYPNWDFGSPRWILGLMYLANVLQPQHCCFDLRQEAEQFYQRFYGVPFVPQRLNLSFARPTTANPSIRPTAPCPG